MDIHQTKGVEKLVGARTATISRKKGVTGMNDERTQVLDKMVSDEYY